jgi:hypothetical protein
LEVLYSVRVRRQVFPCMIHQLHISILLHQHNSATILQISFSYQYVERSINKGRLEDLEAHRAGPSAPRPIFRTCPKAGFSLYDPPASHQHPSPSAQQCHHIARSICRAFYQQGTTRRSRSPPRWAIRTSSNGRIQHSLVQIVSQ